MSEEMQALARGYALLGRMLLGHMSTAELADAVALPGLCPAEDDVEASYVTAFDLGVPPYASVFLDPRGHAGGAVTQRVEAAIRGAGLQPTTDEVAADHLGVMLVHLGTLTSLGRREEAADFAARHLLGWLPALLVALDGVDAPFWRSAVELALAIVLDECPMAPRSVDALVDNPLDDPSSGLREIAAWLATPSRSGLWLGRNDLAAVSRATDLPAGFGTRRDRIETLLRSAAEYDAVPRLCDALDNLVLERTARLQGLGLPAPVLACWTTRLATTRSLLRTLGAKAGSSRQRRAGS